MGSAPEVRITAHTRKLMAIRTESQLHHARRVKARDGGHRHEAIAVPHRDLGVRAGLPHSDMSLVRVHSEANDVSAETKEVALLVLEAVVQHPDAGGVVHHLPGTGVAHVALAVLGPGVMERVRVGKRSMCEYV